MPGEFAILTDVGGGDATDATILEQQAKTRAVDAAIVRHYLPVGGPLVEQRANKYRWDPAQSEAADGHTGAIGDISDRRVGAGHDLVQPGPALHSVFPFR